MTESRSPSCPICASFRVTSKAFGYVFKEKWLGGFECAACGMIFIHPQPTQEEIAGLYSKEYFEGDFRCGHAGSYFDEKTMASLEDEELIQHIKQFQPTGKFLEVGCAGGAFLHTAEKAGYEVKGVEFSDVAARLAREKFGLDVITGDLRDANYPGNMFDVVFMGDVLEHLPDPQATCKEIHRVMAPGGIFVVECPMQTNTLFSRAGLLIYGLTRKRVTVHLPPYHLFEYRPASMATMLRRSGFDIVKKTEGMIPPDKIALRGSGLHKLGKKMFQYPNYILTRMFGVFGDRIEMIARRRS